MDLQEQIDRARQEIRADAYSMSIGEWINLYRDEERAKYELFQRLNTGGSPLSDQEVRNCILVMVNRDFYFWLRRLAEHPAFQESIALTDRAVAEQYDMELVTRYMVFHNMDKGKLLSLGDVGEFLTDQIVTFAEARAGSQGEQEKFTQVFDYISGTIGPNAFRRYDPTRKKHVGGFLVSAFEVVALGLASQDRFPAPEEFETRVRDLWKLFSGRQSPSFTRTGKVSSSARPAPTWSMWGAGVCPIPISPLPSWRGPCAPSFGAQGMSRRFPSSWGSSAFWSTGAPT